MGKLKDLINAVADVCTILSFVYPIFKSLYNVIKSCKKKRITSSFLRY